MGNNVNYSGPGLLTILTAIFVVAKIWGKISWSWWWVFSPIWIPISVGLFVIILMVIIGAFLK